MENKPTRKLSSRAGNPNVDRDDKQTNKCRDGYWQCQPSPTLLTPSDFSIWSAFFPHPVDKVCPMPVKPPIQELHGHFSIWFAFFPGCPNSGFDSFAEPVVPATKSPVCFRSCIIPKSISPASMLVNNMPSSTMKTPIILCRLQSQNPVQVSLIASVSSNDTFVLSSDRIAKQAQLHLTRPARIHAEIGPAEMFQRTVPPFELILKTLMTLFRPIQTGNTLISIGTRPTVLPLATYPTGSHVHIMADMSLIASLISAMNCQGFLKAVECKVFVSSRMPKRKYSMSFPRLVSTQVHNRMRLSLAIPKAVLMRSVERSWSISPSVICAMNGLGSLAALSVVSNNAASMQTWKSLNILFHETLKQMGGINAHELNACIIAMSLSCGSLPTPTNYTTVHISTTFLRSQASLFLTGNAHSELHTFSDTTIPNMISHMLMDYSLNYFGRFVQIQAEEITQKDPTQAIAYGSEYKKINHETPDCCVDIIRNDTYLPILSPDNTRIPMFHTSASPITFNILANDSSSKTQRHGLLQAFQPDIQPDTVLKPTAKMESNKLIDAAQTKRNDEVGFYEESYNIFLRNEEKYKANPSYLDNQRDISKETRSKVISWMAETSELLEICPASLCLAVNILDRFMSNCLVTRNNLQLAAVTCMFIAGKFEDDIEEIDVDDLVLLCRSTYTRSQILVLERTILKKLQFYLYVPTVAWFCIELSRVCNADKKLEHLTMFFAEMTMLDVSYISIKASKIAAAAFCLARYHLGLRVWTLELWERSHYLPEDFLSIIRRISQTYIFFRDIEDEARKGILEKYSTEKYHKVANLAIFSEEHIDRLEEKCKEFGDVDFVSPSRSGSKRSRLWRFSGHDTPFKYDPNAKPLPVHMTWAQLESFERYSADTYRIMLRSECRYLANAGYMKRQTAFSAEIRQLEVNWMVRFIELQHYPSSTLLLAVNLMDRFLSIRIVKRHMLRLLSLACLFIATKYENRRHYKIGAFLAAVEHEYSKDQLIGQEQLILKALDFKLVVPTAAWFCEELLDASNADNTLKALTRYLVELTTLETRYLNYRPSRTASAALCIARYSLGHPPWTELLLERSGYDVKDFRACLRSLYDDYKLSANLHGDLQCKYRKLEHMSVADFNKYPVPKIERLLVSTSKKCTKIKHFHRKQSKFRN